MVRPEDAERWGGAINYPTDPDADPTWLGAVHEAGHVVSGAAIGRKAAAAAVLSSGAGLAWGCYGRSQLEDAVIAYCGPLAEKLWPKPPENEILPERIAAAPHTPFDFDKTPKLREAIETAPDEVLSDADTFSLYVFRRPGWSYRGYRVVVEAGRILERNEDIVLAIAVLLWKFRLLNSRQLSGFCGLVERWDPTEFDREITMKVDELIAGIDQAELKVVEEFEALVVDLAEGVDVTPERAIGVLGRSKKTKDDLRASVEVHRRRMALSDTVAAGLNLEADIEKSKKAIASANAAFEAAGRKRDEAVAPHQRRLQEIYDLQREGERARDELVRTCPHRKLLEANAANNAELEAIDHRMKQLRDGFNIARHDRIGGLSIKQLEEEHAERSKQRDRFESEMGKP